VLLREVDGELVDHLARVAVERAVEAAVAVHDDETVLVVRLEQLLYTEAGGIESEVFSGGL